MFESIVAWGVGACKFFYSFLSMDISNPINAIRHSCRFSYWKSAMIFLGSESNKALAEIHFNKLMAEEDAGWIEHKLLLKAKFPEEIYKKIDRKIFLLTTSAMGHFALINRELKLYGIDKLALILPSQTISYFESVGFFQHISKISGSQIDAVKSDSKVAVRDMLRHSKGGATLVARVDSMPEDTNSFVISPLFGRDAVFPEGILSIAQRLEAALIPVHVTRCGAGIEVHFGTPRHMTDNMDACTLSLVVDGLHEEIEEHIIKRPHFYGSWRHVASKWKMAEAILKEISSISEGGDGRG